jgi:hypothetical protein
MRWDGHTTFSVLSGIALFACALLAHDLKANQRFLGLMGGTFFCGYGIWVGHQTSGVFVFPIWIFFIPFGAVFYIVNSHKEASKREPSRPVGRPTARTTEPPPLPPGVTARPAPEQPDSR